MDLAARSREPSSREGDFALLLFEAAGCLMALPAFEVARLATSIADLPSANAREDTAGPVDLDARFGLAGSEGPWIAWRRGGRRRVLRASRVLGVFAYALGDLRPMPGWLRATQETGPFWAMGTRDEEIFLVLDPGRLATP